MMGSKIEIWKDIRGYEGFYQISSFGRVKSLPRVIDRTVGKCVTKERILKTFRLKGGYINIVLRYNGKNFNHNVHRLVAENFIPNTHPDYSCINHIDGDKANNHVENLEWCNHSVNCLHAYDKGISKKDGKLSDEQVRSVRKKLKIGCKVKDIASEYKVRISIISNIKCNRTYKRVI